MQEALRTSIVDLGQWIDMTKAAVDCFVLREFGIDEIDDNLWSMDVAHRWIRLKIDDELNVQMKWARESFDADDHLSDTILSLVREHGGEKAVDKLYEVLEPTEIFIANLVDQHTGDNQWRIWHTHFRSDWVVLECDEDYRIKVFNEKVASGEWEA